VEGSGLAVDRRVCRLISGDRLSNTAHLVLAEGRVAALFIHHQERGRDGDLAKAAAAHGAG
jgi:hypothetical protein